MTRRCQLLARAEIDGAVREPGYIFTLADDARGPHRTRVPVYPSIHSSHVAGHDHPPSDGVDEPLFIVLPDDPPADAEAQENDAGTSGA